jgi:hypothetical protein
MNAKFWIGFFLFVLVPVILLLWLVCLLLVDRQFRMMDLRAELADAKWEIRYAWVSLKVLRGTSTDHLVIVHNFRALESLRRLPVRSPFVEMAVRLTAGLVLRELRREYRRRTGT